MCSCIYYCGSHKTFSILLPIISPQETSRRISQQQWSIASILSTLNLSILFSQESRSYTWSCSAQQNCVSGSVAFNDGLFQDLGAGTPARMMAFTLPYSNKGNNLYILAVSRWTEWRQWAEWRVDWLQQMLTRHDQFLYAKADTQGVIFFSWTGPFPGQRIPYVNVVYTPLCYSSQRNCLKLNDLIFLPPWARATLFMNLHALFGAMW